MSSLEAVNSSAAPALFYGCSTIAVTAQRERRKDRVPFFFIHLRGFRENVITFAASPGMLLCGMHHCVAGGMRL